MQSSLPSVYTTKLETGSPATATAMLAPINPSYGSHSPLSHSPQPGPYHPQSGVSTTGGGAPRLSWDGFNGYQRLGGGDGSTGPGSDDGEPKARYELAPGDGLQLNSRDSYQLPRVQENASDPQRWYYTNQQAVG